VPSRRSPVLLCALGLVAVSLTACGDIEDQSMCTAYEEYLDARDAIQDVDPEDESAGEAAELVDRYLESVQRLDEAADGRFATELDALQLAVRDVLLTLESVQEDEDYSTWAPLVEDSLEVAADAAVSVMDAIDPECPTPGGEG